MILNEQCENTRNKMPSISYVEHKFHMDWLEIEHGSPGSEATLYVKE
jgi:hypothetical protein